MVQTFDTHETDAMAWNDNYSATPVVSIPSMVADGTYYIKVMSRLHGDGSWQECYDGDAYKMTATIADNQLTINVPIPSNVFPVTATLSVEGDKFYGHEQIVTASITGGAGSYNGDIVLRVNDQAIMGKVLNIGASENVVVEYSFIPNRAGSNTLKLWNRRSGGTQIGTAETVAINLSLSDNKKNNTAVNNNDGVTTDVILDGRTLYKDGGSAVVCLMGRMCVD